jgi:hypothetical protein
MGVRGSQLKESDVRPDAEMDFLSPLQDRGAFLYDIWESETGATVARNSVEKHLIGEAIHNALFEETWEYSSLLKRCHMDGGSELPSLIQQFGESVKPKLKYLLEMYLLEIKDNRLHVSPFYRHLLGLRQKLAEVQLLF